MPEAVCRTVLIDAYILSPRQADGQRKAVLTKEEKQAGLFTTPGVVDIFFA
nr:hypothetical protein [uncultured Cohaesibacter sp.]